MEVDLKKRCEGPVESFQVAKSVLTGVSLWDVCSLMDAMEA